MQRNDFFYELPKQLIAQYPTKRRGDSRLLCLNRATGKLRNSKFDDLIAFIDPEDLLVFNDTRVIPARLFGQKESGGKVEILVERLLGDRQMLAQLRASKQARPGTRIALEDGVELEVIERRTGFFVLGVLSGFSLVEVLERTGHVPLPPYIKRPDTPMDKERYQTVYARSPGAVAAPTAGLHFTQTLLNRLKQKGVAMGFMTLHVGAATFQPLRTETIEDHSMHSEWFVITTELCKAVNQTRKRGGRVIAVGTTSVRGLESAARNGELYPYEGETDIFIYPGFEFQMVDALITNFHLPESTLLMLVCAFAGRGPVLNAYRQGIRENYRFFSYGDAMFIG
ncbi:MAG: tRNA preQ1(34) S-adenosylmethionine ribosyltransferase-isomerase QueA [Gammaproteobacteria bacterium]